MFKDMDGTSIEVGDVVVVAVGDYSPVLIKGVVLEVVNSQLRFEDLVDGVDYYISEPSKVLHLYTDVPFKEDKTLGG